MAAFGGTYSFGGSDDGGDRFLARLLARRLPEDADAEAEVRWGKASNFIAQMEGQAYLPTVTIINLPGYPTDDDEPEDLPVLDWYEQERTISEVRVENPDDEDQYVIVERIETITFQTAEGRRVRLNFRNEDSGEAV